LSEAEGIRSAALTSLGLGPGANEEEIRTAYRRLAMRYHPDATGDPRSAERFAGIVRAYKVLSTFERSAGGDAGADRARRSRYRSVEEAGTDLSALGQVVSSDPDAGARAAAARALGLTGRAAAYVFLRRALYDSVDDVALEAVRAAALLGSRQAEGEVAALYGRSRKPLRRHILESALGTGESLFRSTLEAALKDEEPELRAMAIKARGRREG
jgi:curved DNA-binding protein CbpA